MEVGTLGGTVSIWDNSSFLDLTDYGVTTATSPETAYGFTSVSPISSEGTITVALVLPRVTDPTALLNESWAQREAAFNGLTPAQVGATYGADTTQFDALENYLEGVSGAQILDTDGYVSNAASRTVWVSLSSTAFQTLFNTELQVGTTGSSQHVTFWDGNLTPNSSLAGLAGMWVQTDAEPPATAVDTTATTLTEGPQGVGNTAGGGYQNASTSSGTNQELFPNQVAAQYNFPLDVTGASSVTTPTIGLIEPGLGNTVNPNSDTLLQQYRQAAGVSGRGTISDGPDGLAGTDTNNGSDESSIDIGVVAAAAPNSNIVTYSGSGSVYAALEQAIWGGATDVSALSSSFAVTPRVAPGSPFFAALQGLYEDAALNNISVFQAAGDGGSSAKLATGVPEVNSSDLSPYTVSVGGTSISSQSQIAAAGSVDTGGGPNINAGVATLEANAVAGNVAALEALVAGGLTQDPTTTSVITSFLQTTWNQYDYNATTEVLSPSYTVNEAGGGGVDTAIPEPSYQVNAGIDIPALEAADGVPGGATGKGDPDVSALAGGNTHYILPQDDLSSTTLRDSGGTSAAAPLWASLTAQIQAVFANQGLPSTGYFNDLLYQAAVIDPGAFDDVQFGGNTSTYDINPNGSVTATSGSGSSATSEQITPTGLGYTAGPGYDLTTGLGTPNGILLARALTQIAQAQIYSPNAPAVTDSTGQISAADQTLILQPTLTTSFWGTLSAAGTSFTPASDGSGQGWSAGIAQQTLQSYFDPAMVEAIAGQAQASSTQITVANGQALSISIACDPATPTAQADTTQLGFVDYTADGQSVTLARPLAVAETYGGQDDTDAIVRLRQDSADTDTLSFYRVDDLEGTIDGIAPGQAGYAAAAESRDYSFADGAQSVTGPGDGQFLQTDLTGVNNGDIIAFELTDQTSGQTGWGLASQNPGDTNDLWSYGSDTWGFDDGSAGGDGFDSLVFQLDFTSNAGSGLLAYDTSPAIPVSPTPASSASGPVTIGSGDSTLQLFLSERADPAGAQFTISVDGVQIGGVQTTTADVRQEEMEELDVLGNFAAGMHTVTIDYLLTVPSRLIVDSAFLDAAPIATDGLTLSNAGTASFGFLATGALTPVAVGSGPDTLVLTMSERAEPAGAQFTVSVDGVQIGEVLTTAADVRAGQSTTFDIEGSFGAGPHTAAITYLNANNSLLLLDTATIDGAAVSNSALTLSNDYSDSFNFTATGSPISTVGTGSDTLLLTVSERSAVQGADFTISVDGAQIGGTQVTTAESTMGETQQIAVRGEFGGGTHDVSIDYTNASNSILYVDGASLDGVAIGGSALSLNNIGTAGFSFVGPGNVTPGAAVVGKGPDTLEITTSERGQPAGAQFTVEVDGTQIGGVQTTTADTLQGQPQLLDVLGSFGTGAHTVNLNYINASNSLLIVGGATIDGAAIAGSSTILSNIGTETFTFTAPLAHT